MLSLPAVSVSRSVRQGLGAAPLALRVLAEFENACNLVTAGGQVIALVTRKVGDGPLNIVVDAHLPHLSLPPAGTPASINAERLNLGKVEIGLACPDWDPRPDWDALRAQYPTLLAAMPDLVRLVRRLAPAHGLLALLETSRPTSPHTPRILDAFRNALVDLVPGEIWPPSQVELVAARLAGLGWGLTPAGDDWLAGLLTWAWLAHPCAPDVGAAVVRAAAPRTSTLSAAFLRSAALGECDAAWQNLLTVLAAGRLSSLEAATLAVLAHGATSGADRLAGFLYPLAQSIK